MLAMGKAVNVGTVTWRRCDVGYVSLDGGKHTHNEKLDETLSKQSPQYRWVDAHGGDQPHSFPGLIGRASPTSASCAACVCP